MAHPSPFASTWTELGVPLAPYGPNGTDVALPEAFGPLALEYAAIRKRAVLIDRPDRSVLIVSGDDRIGFLNNMLTQELAKLAQGATTSSFWLNRKGRIDADLRLLNLPDQLVIDLDVHSAAATVRSLEAFVFAEDVRITDATNEWHRLELIGPTATELWTLFAGEPCPEAGFGREYTTECGTILVDHGDAFGVPALSLTVEPTHAVRLRESLARIGTPAGLDRIGDEQAAVGDDGSPASRIRLRDAGWHARNIARIESGQPQFMLDFGPTNLPAETGLLSERVSFTKGCYLGQEVVARMHALGHPKQTLVALRCEQRVVAGGTSDFLQPQTGSVLTPPGEPDTVIGAVTSATLSPTLGNIPVCFAQVKWGHHEPGTRLSVDAEGVMIAAEIQPMLRFV